MGANYLKNKLSRVGAAAAYVLAAAAYALATAAYAGTAAAYARAAAAYAVTAKIRLTQPQVELEAWAELGNMKDLIKEVIEETLGDPDVTPNSDETLNKLENMKHIIEELEDNNIEEAPSQSQQQFLEENNPETPTSVENLGKMINEISNNPDILLEETKTELDTIKKLTEMSQIIKQVANKTSQESIQVTDVEIHEKVEEMKDNVKEISFRTKENLGGEVTENVADIKNLIRDLEKETLMLKGDDLKDANMNDVKELIMKITEISHSGRNEDEVMEILEKLDDIDTIVNDLMVV